MLGAADVVRTLSRAQAATDVLESRASEATKPP